MNNLKALKWDSKEISGIINTSCESPLHNYTVYPDQYEGGYVAYYFERMTNESGSKFFNSLEDAKEWCEYTHYPSKMQKYVKLDSITDITNWFQKAKPEPTARDALVQQGCHFEEVVEHLISIGIENDDLYDLSNDLKNNTRLQTDDAIANYIDTIDNLELLDALCDQIVTATGVAYMMGFDIEGALKEVIRSNNSKMSDGKFEFDKNGKIMKAEGYSQPNLKPFLE